MSWFRRGQIVLEESGTAVNLTELQGLPGELLFAHGVRDQLVRVPCKVPRVDRQWVVVEPTGGGLRPETGGAVILEVVVRTALVQCYTSVQRAEKSGPLYLHMPARPHITVRRRNPRIDIYVGVTLHTRERPIEATPAQMINLSLDGAACVLSEPLTPSTTIFINMAALGLNPQQVQATVVRCIPTPTHAWVIGLRFEQVRPEQESHLAQYIATFLRTLQEQGEEDKSEV